MKFLVLLLLLAVPVQAAPRKCPPKCKHRTERRCAPKPKCVQVQEPDTPREANRWYEGLEIVGGFRWQEERTCPTLQVPVPHPPIHKDPAFVGARLTLPLNEYAGVFGEFDRDFDQAPKWQASVGVSFKPFAK